MEQFKDFEIFCMGTNIIQRIYSDNAEEVAKIAEKELRRIETTMNFFNPTSEVSRINMAAGKHEVLVSNETFQVIKKAKECSSLCDGTFDITAAPLIKLWSIFSESQRVPLKSEIDNILNLTNYEDISLNEDTNSVKLCREGQKIDLGAIAKGYAADRIIEIYKESGIKSAFINIGGNVLTLGRKPDGLPWSIGIQNPFEQRGKYIGAIKVSDKTVVTSGDYVRYFEKDKIRYHHILDPRTGYPSESGIISATIIGKSSMEADALSTAVFILGLKNGVELVNRINGVEAIFITSDKNIYVTEGAREKVQFIDTNSKFKYLEKII